MDVEEVRFDEGRRATLKTRKRASSFVDRVVSKDDVEFTKFRVGSFNENDRAGIDGAHCTASRRSATTTSSSWG